MGAFFSNPMTLIFLFIMVMQSMRGFSNPMDWLLNNLLILPGIIVGLSLHEFAHAKAADVCGDPTPRMQGRLTTNPLAHIDPLGLIALLFIGFGWGKPVQINPFNFKHRRRDEIIVSLAGVVTNFVVALLCMGLIRLGFTAGIFHGTLGGILRQIVQNIVLINIVLMVFNLLPVPPLDGFNFFSNVLNLKNSEVYNFVYRNGFIILMVLIVFGLTSRVLSPAVTHVYRFLYQIWF